MSRIIVKGLPTYLTDDGLKSHFNKRLISNHENTTDELITDVKILKDKNGQSRRFAFIGFRNEADAHDAVNYFNGSYINTAKLEVSMAKSFADPGVPQSMREKKREAYKRMREREAQLAQEEESARANKKQKNVPENTSRGIDAEIAKDKQLQEFIETMKPGAHVASWEKVGSNKTEETESTIANDEADNAQGNLLLAHALAMKKDEPALLKETASDDEYEELNKKSTETQADEGDEPMMSLDQLDEGAVANSENNLAQDEKVSDLDWFKQRRVRIKDGANEPVKKPTQPQEEEEATDAKPEYVEPAQPEKSEEEVALEKIGQTGRLFLRNILYNSTEQDFRDLFSPFGELEEVHIAVDIRTGKSKGFAYILFKNPKDAIQAYIELDKQIFQGRLLHILPGESKKNHRLDEFDLKNMPLKKQRELKKKATASKQSFSWNSLYMNQDAVLASVANKLGMQKSDLIDAENSNSAVKQALAEAHVIGDVRKYFEAKGVDLTKFLQMRTQSDRDDRVILVKNFPFGTNIEELGELFLPFGKLERLLLPPAGTIAIVQYKDIPSARAAFTKLAYKRFKDGIIYLEKGPKNCFARDATADEAMEKETAPAVEIKPSVHDIMEGNKSKEEVSQDAHERDDDAIDGPTVSIFVKNLNFSTTSVQLTDRFKKFGGFVVAQVKTKPDPKREGHTLSMGFGFVEFRTKEQANAVISAMDGEVIDGHKIQLKLSHRQSNNTSSHGSNKNSKSGKIIVKNLPFEATRKDVFELFNSFGQLKSVRVPKKFDKSTRGFAFVEFLLPKEAEDAMDQLQGVHLLGRRLVMQYAEQEAADAEEEIARMTKKVKKQIAAREFSELRNSGGRKRLDIDDGTGNEFDGF
ncbi:RNA-binding ribosome biosynthesis protein MRD1 KNAG_0A07610 [Huiozyma naganishii CBS 8797]|uniref:Multiple RNA-binding domain-containing protein 1 n=1 Tax=Huiozyma naganishii (strain ATCC MYA-139 / BCRC 22969 / CBS 8797 / KCTC 17520 / NBRC 10181 / NCYC 3082 / Yp74L-3) TaxID=1071383 RepID=J7S2Y8_HUIN7|nr:hypothetical protein KNAG_0A07610 [Kazachstania naganishii CBS 8797]CCK68414.1 hypothetical protein KNAG_0A07610 [Kazachstania naganishii CBS 8797]